MEFYMPVQVIGTPVSENGERLRALGRRCLVVTGAHAAEQSGALDDMMTTLQKAGVQAAIFSGVSENPGFVQCHTIADAAEAAGAKFLVGIGGGSVMDATKAAAWLAANTVVDPEKLFAAELRYDPLPVVLVGTTAGTGSEVSAVAVITDLDGRKRSVKTPKLYATYAFADPRYTYSVPRGTTVSAALDVLAHTVEGWFNPDCDEVSTVCAEQALPRLARGLSWLCAHDGLPPAALRDDLYAASLWAGQVLNRNGTAFPHAMGYVLTEDGGLPHGQACAAFLPALTARGEQYAPQRAARLFALCGGQETYDGWLRTLSAPAASAVHMTEAQIAGYAARWQQLPHYRRTPGGFSAEQAAVLCRTLFGGAPNT